MSTMYPIIEAEIQVPSTTPGVRGTGYGVRGTG